MASAKGVYSKRSKQCYINCKFFMFLCLKAVLSLVISNLKCHLKNP